jgi:predicted Holliday junction resolvase-like endonuclease
VKGAHWKLLCQFAEKNDTPDSIKQSFRKLKKERQLQAEDARRERARVKEAKAAQRKKAREEEASAKEFYREHANSLRKKAASRSEAELRKLGGKKEVIPLGESRRQTRWIFGPEGQTRFIHTPEDGLWRLEGMPSREEQ